MLVIKRFLLEESPEAIRPRLLQLLGESLDPSKPLEQRAAYVKKFLGLLKELTMDRDTRMGFDEN